MRRKLNDLCFGIIHYQAKKKYKKGIDNSLLVQLSCFRPCVYVKLAACFQRELQEMETDIIFVSRELRNLFNSILGRSILNFKKINATAYILLLVRYLYIHVHVIMMFCTFISNRYGNVM